MNSRKQTIIMPSSECPRQLRHDPPLFDGTNYATWRSRMREYLISQSFGMWKIVANGPLTPLKKEKDGTEVPLNDTEINRMGYDKHISLDYKAKLVLTDALTEKEYAKVGTCQSAKQMWDTLEAIYGHSRVVGERLYCLNSEFVLFKMKSGESLSDFHARFMKIITEMFELGKIVPEKMQVDKILYSLTPSFNIKVSAIESNRDPTMTVADLIGKLLAFEMRCSSTYYNV